MGRGRRVELIDGIYHVTSRGNNREPIVWDDGDRAAFVTRLGVVAAKMRWQVWAWCLMTNHYHALIQIPHGGLSDGMQILNGGHSRAIAGRYGRSRHLFQNRFGAKLIEQDEHLLATCRYIVLNPCRAYLCDHPAGWLWGSFRATAGLDASQPFLATERVLALFERPSVAEARKAYSRFVEGGMVSDTVPAV